MTTMNPDVLNPQRRSNADSIASIKGSIGEIKESVGDVVQNERDLLRRRSSTGRSGSKPPSLDSRTSCANAR